MIHIPPKFANMFIRLLNLRMGRYLVVLTIDEDNCDWSISHVGKVER